MKVMLLMRVVTIDIPVAQDGIDRLAMKYCSVMVCRRAKRSPIPVRPRM